MARKELKKITTIDDNDPIQVESAIRDGVGDNIENKYAQQDGAYENLWAGNLITDTNWRWVNDFAFGTGTVDTVFDGEATIYAIRGKTRFTQSVSTFIADYVYDLDHYSIMFNLYIGSVGLDYAHVVESDNENNGLCVYGTGVVAGTIMEFSETSDFANITEIALTEETNSTGETYLHCNVPSDGYIRFKGGVVADGCISNVWGGNRVSYHPQFEMNSRTISVTTYFPNGMKGVKIGGEEVVFDELYANRYYERVKDYSFGATPSVSYVNASGTYNIYRMSLTNAMNQGSCEISLSTKFAWSDVGAMSSSTPISADSMSLASGYIYFSIAQSEDSTYTYSEDSAIVDQASFESELASKGALFTLVGGEYVSATTYTSGATYYYISATNLHGLNGQAIIDEIKNRIIVYQIRSMDKTVYIGTAITPALEWTYRMGDFGTEELICFTQYNQGTYDSDFVPDWIVYYPVNVVETVQQLPNNYVSLESAENLLHQVGELQGFDFESIEVDEETGNMKVNGLVDTKETILNLNISIDARTTSGTFSQGNILYDITQKCHNNDKEIERYMSYKFVKFSLRDAYVDWSYVYGKFFFCSSTGGTLTLYASLASNTYAIMVSKNGGYSIKKARWQ